jgi:hypothetical protein
MNECSIAKFAYVSQQCAVFVFRHTTLRVTGIHEAARGVDAALVMTQTRRAYISVTDDEIRREIA